MSEVKVVMKTIDSRGRTLIHIQPDDTDRPGWSIEIRLRPDMSDQDSDLLERVIDRFDRIMERVTDKAEERVKELRDGPQGRPGGAGNAASA